MKESISYPICGEATWTRSVGLTFKIERHIFLPRSLLDFSNKGSESRLVKDEFQKRKNSRFNGNFERLNLLEHCTYVHKQCTRRRTPLCGHAGSEPWAYTGGSSFVGGVYFEKVIHTDRWMNPHFAIRPTQSAAVPNYRIRYTGNTPSSTSRIELR